MHRLLLVVGLILATLALAACGGGDDAGTSAASSTCDEVETPAPKQDGGATKPSAPLDPDTTYTLLFKTSCGDFEVTLDQETAPETAASLVSLASAGFYDGTVVHRVVPGFVIQGGDPLGADPARAGTGGPGYSTTDVPPPDTTYTRGVVAMAKAPDEPPGTAGSQFFVVTGEDVGLPPDYTVVGQVTEGFDTVQQIEALGDVATEQPSQTVVVERVSVRES